MILIDAVAFIIIIAGLHYYKIKSPNFLFFCKGAVLFLPPDDEEVTNEKPQKQKGSSNDKSKKQGHQISVLQVEYNHVKTYPFCNQYERVSMTIVALILLLIVRIPLKLVFPTVSLLPFYLISAITIYAVKIAVDVFMVSAYKSTVCFLIALGVNLIYFFLIFFLGNYEGVYDNTIQSQASDYAKYMEIVFGNKVINWINLYSVMGLVVFANFFITLAAIPSIVKFGNWYAKTLKQVYYEQDPSDISSQRLLNSTAQSTKQAQQKVKLNSKHVISLLNYYLVAVLVFSCLSHRVCLGYVPQVVIDGLRIVFFMISTIIILWTSKQAMQFNGSFAYKFVIQYFNQKSKEGRQMLKRKIVPYIYHMWYHLYQFMTRVIIPILLLCLVMNWKYMSSQTDIESVASFKRQFNSQIQCRVNVNEFQMFKNLYKCPIKSSRQMEEEKRLQTYSIVTGTLDGLPKDLNPSQLQERVLKYGVIKRSFMVQFSEMLLWYANITIYSMTVVYVLFLRKTVYEI